MRENEYEEDIYIIPHNYKESGKFLGIIEPSSLFLGMGWLFIIGFLLYLIPFFTSNVKVISFVFVGGAPAALIFIGWGHDSIVDFAKYYYEFIKNARVYHYKK